MHCGWGDPLDRINSPSNSIDKHTLRKLMLTKIPTKRAQCAHTSFKRRSRISLTRYRRKGGSPMHGRWASSHQSQNPREIRCVWMTTALSLLDRHWGSCSLLSLCDAWIHGLRTRNSGPPHSLASANRKARMRVRFSSNMLSTHTAPYKNQSMRLLLIYARLMTASIWSFSGKYSGPWEYRTGTLTRCEHVL